jgi:mannose-6-phosphate isomerase-like protein (cupin superfamily)
VGEYTVAHLDDIDEISDGRVPWRPVRHHLGIKAFGVNAFTGKNTGDRIINEHDEADQADLHEELYFVASGRARFELDGETVDAPVGTFVFARPSVLRTAFAEEPGTTLVAVGAARGQAYEPSGWEIWAPLRELYEAGDYAAAADRGRELVADNPEYSVPIYNLACCEALAGRTEDAIGHLQIALERSGEQLRSVAREDSDLDSLRDDPRFKELVK